MEHVNGFKAVMAAAVGCLTALWGWFGWLVLAWIGVMVLDYLTGSAAACKAGAWSSSVAREGLWHKLGSIVAVGIAAILDLVVGLVIDNVPSIQLPFAYTVFLSVLVLAWYILTEVGSIAENAGKLGAPIPPFLTNIIAALKGTVDKAGDKLPDEQRKD